MTERISYAQNGEDVRVWRALRGVPDPFYVEVGASHPFDDSLTAALYAAGWHGLLIEPEPASAEVLRRARPRDTVVAAAASASPGVLSWSDDDGVRGHGAVSSTPGGITVPAVRVADLLDHLAPEAVHFLSVDVEGHEKEALEGVDLARWQPWVLCVEATAPTSREQTHAAWEPLVRGAGYTFAAFDGLNRWYVAPGHEDLVDAVSEPFGVLDRILDGWVPSDLQAADGELDRLRQELADARSRHAIEREHQQAEHAAALARVQVEHITALRRAQDELGALQAELAAALAREQVLLTSKSWRLTRPLREARVLGGSRLPALRPAAPSPPATTSPAELRRTAATLAKVLAARRRAAS